MEKQTSVGMHQMIPSDEDDHNLAKAVRAQAQPKMQRPVMYAENKGDGRIVYEFMNIPHEQAWRIVFHVLPRVINLWLEKTADYGDSTISEMNLGPKAEFVRIWNKVGKLKTALWHDRALVGEQVDEIVSDFIGHNLIILDAIWTSPNRPGGVR
jgi:hypothetical protein